MLVIVDDERLASVPDASGSPFAPAHRRVHVLLEDTSRDAHCHPLRVLLDQRDEGVLGAKHFAHAPQHVLQQVIEIETVQRPDHHLVQRRDESLVELRARRGTVRRLVLCN